MAIWFACGSLDRARLISVPTFGGGEAPRFDMMGQWDKRCTRRL
jgi:hypothetical protein